MILAAISYAGVNITVQWAGMVEGIGSASIAFWQYLLATLFSFPLLYRLGIQALKTHHPWMHLLRVLMAAGGVQVWIIALAHVPLWQAIALVMTSPFFVLAGASLFLREHVNPARIMAAVIGFVGAIIIIRPWSQAFSLYSLLPVLSAGLWAGTSLITKVLTRTESASSIAIYLMLMLTPINLALYASSGDGLPHSGNWIILILAGVCTAASQYFLTRAYSLADAAYLQPFDDFKLPLNLILGWLVFGGIPSLTFWPGAALILAGSLMLMGHEAHQWKNKRSLKRQTPEPDGS
ncbi:Riboflavin transporter [Halomonadaceae bacterium LMG 33818]|uniref:DMT family transporter n=1 Tax=Cernens ardua TaxID=3402176 RepID=UPI003EDC6D39